MGVSKSLIAGKSPGETGEETEHLSQHMSELCNTSKIKVETKERSAETVKSGQTCKCPPPPHPT